MTSADMPRLPEGIHPVPRVEHEYSKQPFITKTEDVDPRLLWLLRKAGDEWGPRGVYLVAASLAGVKVDV